MSAGMITCIVACSSINQSELILQASVAALIKAEITAINKGIDGENQPGRAVGGG